MSDGANIMPKGYGTPLAWVFSDSGEVLRMKDDIPISRYMIDFKYVYSEENDDTCDIKFNFKSLEVFNLPYLKQDIKLKVQWGYLVGTGEFIKSTKRKVVIRDIEIDYLSTGIYMTLKCTDLISYLKNQKTTTSRKYKNRDGQNIIVEADKQTAHFIEWLKEIAAGQFTASVTVKKQTLRIDRNGTTHIADFDPKTGRRQQQRITTAIPKKFKKELWVARSIKGKSKAIANAIEDKLKFFGAIDGASGPFIRNGTDDNLHIHQRNFKQDPLASFTYYGGTGELIDFKSKTNTTKIKEDKALTSGVNPYNKEIETQEVSLAVTEDSNKESREDAPSPQKGWGVPLEALSKWTDEAAKVFNDDLKDNLNQKELKDLTYLSSSSEPRRKLSLYPSQSDIDANIKRLPKFVSIQSADVINLPEFQDVLTEKLALASAKLQKDMVLIGYLVEKVQRKYEATCRIIGDPSLTKSKVYEFRNLSHLDNGKWYATSVTHSISKKVGYFTTMELIKVPSAIGINKNSSTENKEGEKKATNENVTIYDGAEFVRDVLQEDGFYDRWKNIDFNRATEFIIPHSDRGRYNPDGSRMEGFKERMERIAAEEDFLREHEEEIKTINREKLSKALKAFNKKNTDNY